MTVNAKALAIMAKINKKHPGTTLLAANVRPTTRISTGSLAVDVVLGGGWPVSQWSEIVGLESHGKTCLAMQTVRANQEADPEFTTVWVAAEGWNPEYAAMNGVDPSRVIIVENGLMEDAYAAVLEYCESGVVDLIVIDSLPMLVPEREDTNEIGETTPGRAAYLTNQFFRKVGKAMKRSSEGEYRPVTGLVINQWRSKIGVSHGDPRTTGGGMGKDYAYYIKLDIRRSEWIEIGSSGDKKRIGQGMTVRVIKNKTAPPQRVAFFDYYFDEGGVVPAGSIDYAKEILLIGIEKDVIKRGGAWYYYPDKEGRKWNGSAALLTDVYAEPDLADEITREVLDYVRIEQLG